MARGNNLSDLIHQMGLLSDSPAATETEPPETGQYWQELATSDETPNQADLFPPDDRICPTCAGLGQVTVNAPNNPEWHNKLVLCTNPSCPVTRGWRKSRAVALEQKYLSALDDSYLNFTFDSWRGLDISGKYLATFAAQTLAKAPQNPFLLSQAIALTNYAIVENETQLHPESYCYDQKQVMIEFPKLNGERRVMSFPNSFGNWLVLTGGYGIGKTGLAMAVYNALKADYFAYYVHLPTYIEDWQATYNLSGLEAQNAQRAMLAPLQEADILIVDEINVQERGGVASEDKERLFFNQIIHPRHSAKWLKPIIMTTNKPLVMSAKERSEALAKNQETDLELHWGKRIIQRIQERAHILHVGGAILRKQNQVVQSF